MKPQYRIYLHLKLSFYRELQLSQKRKHVFITTKNGALLPPHVGKVNLLESISLQANATI